MRLLVVQQHALLALWLSLSLNSDACCSKRLLLRMIYLQAQRLIYLPTDIHEIAHHAHCSQSCNLPRDLHHPKLRAG